jgi:hypothetical protein
MTELKFNKLTWDIELWLYNTIGHGGYGLDNVPGCDGLEDTWDGDKWHIKFSYNGTRILFKYAEDAMMFKLRWL